MVSVPRASLAIVVYCSISTAIACVPSRIEATPKSSVDSSVRELIMAAQAGDEARVGMLLRSGVDADSADEEGRSALIAAADAGRLSTVRLLLEAGARLNKTNANGSTALATAASWGNVE